MSQCANVKMAQCENEKENKVSNLHIILIGVFIH